MDNSKIHLVIVRTTGIEANISSYNCQELGLAKALIKKGIRVTLVFGAHGGNRKEIISVYDKSLDVYHVKYWGIHHRYTWFLHLESLLKSLEPSIVQVHDMDVFMTWRVIRWTKVNNIKSILIQGPYDKWRYLILRQANEIYNRTFGRYIIKNVTRIGIKTLQAGKYLDQYYKREYSLVEVGLDYSKFDYSNIKSNTHLLNKLELENKKVLIYVGVMQNRRSPMFLLEVISKLPKDYVLILVGDGPLVPNMKAFIELNSLSDRCFMLGKLSQKELPSLYQKANLFLLASNYEIFGMVVMEAMFFGLPVLSTRTAGAETLIEEGNDGYILDKLDAIVWKSKIEEICSIESPNFKSICHKKIVDNYSWDKIADKYIQLYR